MPVFSIQSPADPSLYPFRLIGYAIADGTVIDEKDPIAILELADGRVIRQATPIPGIFRGTVKLGTSFNERAEIARIEQVEEEQKQALPINHGPPWHARFSREQTDLIEKSYAAEFGVAAQGDPSLHPADRIVVYDPPSLTLSHLKKLS